jgi:BMFP domain-containing protein YqiC
MLGVGSLQEQLMNRRQLFSIMIGAAAEPLGASNIIQSFSRSLTLMKNTTSQVKHDLDTLRQTIGRDLNSLDLQIREIKKKQNAMIIAIVGIAIFA